MDVVRKTFWVSQGGWVDAFYWCAVYNLVKSVNLRTLKSKNTADLFHRHLYAFSIQCIRNVWNLYDLSRGYNLSLDRYRPTK